MGLEIKTKVRIIQVLVLDSDCVELTCNTLVTKKMILNPVQFLKSLDEIRSDMVQATPKVFKVPVSMEYYKNNKLNIMDDIDIGVECR